MRTLIIVCLHKAVFSELHHIISGFCENAQQERSVPGGWMPDEWRNDVPRGQAGSRLSCGWRERLMCRQVDADRQPYIERGFGSLVGLRTSETDVARSADGTRFDAARVLRLRHVGRRAVGRQARAFPFDTLGGRGLVDTPEQKVDAEQ